MNDEDEDGWMWKNRAKVIRIQPVSTHISNYFTVFIPFIPFMRYAHTSPSCHNHYRMDSLKGCLSLLLSVSRYIFAATMRFIHL